MDISRTDLHQRHRCNIFAAAIVAASRQLLNLFEHQPPIFTKSCAHQLYAAKHGLPSVLPRSSLSHCINVPLPTSPATAFQSATNPKLFYQYLAYLETRINLSLKRTPPSSNLSGLASIVAHLNHSSRPTERRRDGQYHVAARMACCNGKHS